MGNKIVRESLNESTIWGNDKLYYEDQYRGKKGLSASLAKDLGMPLQWGGAKDFGFDNVDLYGGQNEKTILPGALSGKYTYDDLLTILRKHFKK